MAQWGLRAGARSTGLRRPYLDNSAWIFLGIGRQLLQRPRQTLLVLPSLSPWPGSPGLPVQCPTQPWKGVVLNSAQLLQSPPEPLLSPGRHPCHPSPFCTWSHPSCSHKTLLFASGVLCVLYPAAAWLKPVCCKHAPWGWALVHQRGTAISHSSIFVSASWPMYLANVC